MNADGSGDHNLSGASSTDGWPSWSPDGKRIVLRLSISKMPSGAHAFEISDIQEERNREPVLAKRPECSNVTLLH
jgi:hypothetical protein